MKPRSKPRFLAVFAVFLAVGLLTACNSPMGLGKPVDTLAPTVVIDAPADNEFIRGILLGSPVIVTGYVFDDLSGPDKLTLSFEMYNKTAARSIKPDNVAWEIDEDGKWRAEITITATEGAEDYTIKVFAQDAFKNKGSAIVNVRLDIVPPWIRSSQITRHPGSGFNFSSALYPLEHYVNGGYMEDGAYRNIPYLKIDEYQNEVFTVRLEIEPSYADVAASRLYVKSRGDAYLHEEGLVPSGYWRGEGLEALRYPEWKITASQITGWDSAYAAGASYLLFEVWAYSEAAWDKGNDRPFPGEPGRVQRIGGTVWLPESDKPHAQINPEIFVNDVIVLERSADSALAVDFYDDDRLGVIYTKLLPKLELLALCGGLSEEEYLDSLTDPADRQGKRAALISKLQLTNALVQSAGDGRFQRIEVSTKGLELGEYRLIALARDDKSKTGYSFESVTPESWGVYPPVNIQVSDVNAPFIFVEKPEVENIVPPLIDGESFVMSGFILGRMETRTLNIAWVPKALQTGKLDAVIEVLEGERASALSADESFTANGITVWGVELREDTEKTVLNGVEYFRVEFEKIFHIIDDFQYNGNLENDEKLLVLHAANYSTRVYSTFNLLALKTGPDIEVTQPKDRGTGHDPIDDLLLKMKVSQAAGGAAVKPGSQTITDVTINETNAGFNGPTALDGGEWTRKILSDYIQRAYDKGSTRVFSFKAQDILGNVTEHTREIIFTDQPLLESISCTETAGTFGIGHVLRFEATFSMQVTVTLSGGQWARLKLYLTDPGDTATNKTPDRYAEYDPSSPSGKTIAFTYTVQEDDDTSKLCTSLDAIVLSPGAMIIGTKVEADLTLRYPEGLLQKNSTIALDGLRPSIARASFAPLAGFSYNGVSYYTNGKTITLKLIIDNENKTVKVNGIPRAIIRYGGANTREAQYAYKTTTNGIDTLFFTHTFSDGGTLLDQTQLEWSTPWFSFPDNSTSITDMAGNNIIPDGYDARLTNANRRGEAVAPYPSERGYVKTRPPTAPGYTLHTSSAGAQNNNGIVSGTPLLRNAELYLRVNGREVPDTYGVGGTILYYSLQGGAPASTPLTITGNNLFGTAPIPDDKSALKYTPAYEKSQYVITAWREDLAGNRSPQAAPRDVTINSRWPELVSIDIGLPEGDYQQGTVIPFKLNFSDKVRKSDSAIAYPGSYPITCDIYASYVPNSGDIDPITNKPREVSGVIATYTTSSSNVYWEGNETYTNVVCFDWPAVANPNIAGNFHDIKLSRITLGPFQDEYGNNLRNYSGIAAESSTNVNRPIGVDINTYTFQLNRPNLWIHVDGPLPVSSNPIMGGDFYQADTGGAYPFTAQRDEMLNGGIVTSTSAAPGSFTLTYDVPITKVTGKNITVKPYGNWAVPIILTVEEMDYLLNHPKVKNNEEFKRRLTYVDRNDDPVDYYDNYGWNNYTKTTHGITDIGGLARPDTTTKWVLKFSMSPYSSSANDRTAKLREVFEAAEWKVQTISVGSNQVTIGTGSNNKTATIRLSEALLPGRIWEVIPDAGAFTDAAGNPSGRGYALSYRFWSQTTAAPVVRVNRVSYNGTGIYQVPPDIDTEVRIDCETPGANISYAVYRTQIQLGFATTWQPQGDNNYLYNIVYTHGVNFDSVFTNNDDYLTMLSSNPVLGAQDGYYREERYVFLGNAYQDPENYPEHLFPDMWGYRVIPVYDSDYIKGTFRNTIGNDDYTTAIDSNGFFNTLLRPNVVQTNLSPTYPNSEIHSNNGAPSSTHLRNIRTYPAGVGNSGSTVYRTVSASGGTVTRGPYIDSNGYFYVGEAYQTTSKTPSVPGHPNSSDADPRLYTGRRDYVIATARKNAVTSGNVDYQGPALATPYFTSSDFIGMEGVYKTTVIFREPFELDTSMEFGATRMWLSGVSDIPVTTVSGFPFKGIKNSSSPSGSAGTDGPFFKRAYRIGGYYYVGTVGEGTLNPTPGLPAQHLTNNHLWVSWEIVTDWFLDAWATALSQNFVHHMANRKKTATSSLMTPQPSGDLEQMINEDYITATYGGITYRYRQLFLVGQ